MDTIEGMRTFVAVAKAGSFTAAAESLGRSTALVSKYVQQLEERLQARLLERTTRSLRLTEIGEGYFQRAEDLLTQFDELEASLEKGAAVPSGRLVVSAPVTYGEQYITKPVARYTKKFPGVQVDLRLTDRFVNLVDEGIDVAIRVAQISDSSLVARRLCSSPVICCASPEYLEEFGVPQVPADLKNHRCIVDINQRRPGSWPFVVNKRRIAVSVDGPVIINSARAAAEIALEGGGIGLIPSYAIGAELDSGRLVALLGEYQAFVLGVHAVYSHRKYLAAKTRTFVDHLAKELGDES